MTETSNSIITPKSQILNLKPLAEESARRWHISKLRLSNLQKLAKANSTNRQFDWEKFGYCCGGILREFDPDRKYNLAPKGSRPRWRSWPACAPETVLTRGKYRMEVSLKNVPDRILKAVDAGLKRSRSFKGVMGSELVAKIMGVTYSVRIELDLRAIGAIDVPRAERAALAEKRRLERNKDFQARKRQAAGATARGQSIAAQARALGIAPATLRQRLRRKSKLSSQAVVVESNVISVTFSAPHKNKVSYSNLSADENVTFIVPIGLKGLSREGFLGEFCR